MNGVLSQMRPYTSTKELEENIFHIVLVVL